MKTANAPETWPGCDGTEGAAKPGTLRAAWRAPGDELKANEAALRNARKQMDGLQAEMRSLEEKAKASGGQRRQREKQVQDLAARPPSGRPWSGRGVYPLGWCQPLAWPIWGQYAPSL